MSGSMSSTPASGQLQLKKIGGNSLSTFWANYKDRYQSGLPKSQDVSAISKKTVDAKNPYMQGLSQKVLNPP